MMRESRALLTAMAIEPRVYSYNNKWKVVVRRLNWYSRLVAWLLYATCKTMRGFGLAVEQDLSLGIGNWATLKKDGAWACRSIRVGQPYHMAMDRIPHVI